MNNLFKNRFNIEKENELMSLSNLLEEKLTKKKATAERLVCAGGSYPYGIPLGIELRTEAFLKRQ